MELLVGWRQVAAKTTSVFCARSESSRKKLASLFGLLVGSILISHTQDIIDSVMKWVIWQKPKFEKECQCDNIDPTSKNGGKAKSIRQYHLPPTTHHATTITCVESDSELFL